MAVKSKESRNDKENLFLSFYPKGYNPYKTKWYDIVIAFILFIITLIAYIRTLTPTVGAGDSGELITALYNMGACHPPGYPLYAIVGKLFTFIPIGDIAYRVNIFTAVAGAGAVLFGYLTVVKLLGLNRDTGGLSIFVHIPAIASSFVFGFSLTHWGQAVGGEVYSLNMFLVSMMIYVMLLWYEEMVFYRNEEKLHFAERMTMLLFFVMGLSLTNHQFPMWYIGAYVLILLPVTISIIISERSDDFGKQLKDRTVPFFIFIVVAILSVILFLKNGYLKQPLLLEGDVPIVLFSIFIIPSYLTLYSIYAHYTKKNENNWVDNFFRILSIGMWLFIFAMTLYLYLMVRAKALAPLSDPKPFSWGDTQTLDVLFNHMMRRQYGIGGGGDLNAFWQQMGAVIGYIREQFDPINLVFAIAGLCYLY